MNKKEIQIEYNKKIELFNKLNKYYFDKNKPIVSDAEHEAGKKSLQHVDYGLGCVPLSLAQVRDLHQTKDICRFLSLNP